MSSILAFKPKSSNGPAGTARQAPAGAPRIGGAEIVIFPGVRYERLESAPSTGWLSTTPYTTDAKQQA